MWYKVVMCTIKNLIRKWEIIVPNATEVLMSIS
jgi:hypothetical protein